MKIMFVTIALDAQPFIGLIYAELRKLPEEIEWQWFVCEGVASPIHCTKWCSYQKPRLSVDGTTEFLDSLSGFDNRVVHQTKAEWEGKVAMVNNPLILSRFARQKDDFLVWQMDADELWTAEQIRELHGMFTSNCYPEKNAAFFWCRYFVGPDKVITTRNCFGNKSNYEWLRVWKVKPGMLFRTHEPPVIDGLKLNPFIHPETEARGLVFDHYAYATRAQVAFKEQYYAGPNNPNARYYKGLTERWDKFQQQQTWPRPLREIFPWAEPFATVNKL